VEDAIRKMTDRDLGTAAILAESGIKHYRGRPSLARMFHRLCALLELERQRRRDELRDADDLILEAFGAGKPWAEWPDSKD
jgi:hypothetical protein